VAAAATAKGSHTRSIARQRVVSEIGTNRPESDMHDQKITGACYCGKVRFEATGPVLSQANCHCDNCRRAAGAQSVAWITVNAPQFGFTSGTPKKYRTDTGACRTFCPDCGTSLTYGNDSRPGEIDITIGSVDDPERFRPTKDVFADEKLSWVPLVQENGGF
jgi:hypothetical protein